MPKEYPSNIECSLCDDLCVKDESTYDKDIGEWFCNYCYSKVDKGE